MMTSESLLAREVGWKEEAGNEEKKRRTGDESIKAVSILLYITSPSFLLYWL